MKIAVYGTLKSGYGNNYILTSGTGRLIGEAVFEGYKLYHAGFPVAAQSIDDSILVEIWDIGSPNINEDSLRTLQRLDRLEGEGTMYDRVGVMHQDELIHMYVGNPGFWDFNQMQPERRDANGVYYWSRGV